MAYVLPFKLKYMLMLTIRSQEQHYQFYRLFAKNTTFGSLVFISKIIIYGASIYPSLMKDSFFFGLLTFTPKRHSICGFGNICFMQDPLRVIGLHPEAKHGYIWKWLCLGLTEFYLAFGTNWPPEKERASKWTRVHRSVYPSSSSEEGSHRCVASKNVWKK